MKKTVASLLSTAAALSLTAGCISNKKEPVAAPQTYVLVHGAWQAPYVWDSVQADLSKSGNKVVVVELPGHGSDTTPPHQLNLDVYSDKVIDAISKADSNVILVGHSMGGNGDNICGGEDPFKDQEAGVYRGFSSFIGTGAD